MTAGHEDLLKRYGVAENFSEVFLKRSGENKFGFAGVFLPIILCHSTVIKFTVVDLTLSFSFRMHFFGFRVHFVARRRLQRTSYEIDLSQ